MSVTNELTYLAMFKPYPKVTVAVDNAKGGAVKGAGAYLAGKTGDPYYKDVLPPDGGVTVSILGVARGSAPCSGVYNGSTFEWFELPGGYKLTTWDLSSATSFCWWRPEGL